MIHPFEAMFSRALKRSTSETNLVLREAEKLREKGYAPLEILTVLRKMKISRIDETEESIVGEAAEVFESYVSE